MSKCKYFECKKYAVFGKPGTKIKEYCSSHSPPDYIDVVNKRCSHPGCKTQPSYGKPGTKIREYCKIHAPVDYIDVINKRCIHSRCIKLPVFGKPGTKIKEFCKIHSPLDYINVTNKRCIHSGCDTIPVFGKPGTNNKEYCKIHSPVDYIDVTHKRCIYPGCDTIPSYGKSDTKIKEYCKIHSPVDYINVTNKKCIYPKCKTRASYGKPGTNIKEYCKIHAPIDYIDLVHKRCIHSGCQTRPVFGKPGTNIKEYCKIHSPIDYINVAYKRCIHPGCQTRASYGLLFGPKIHCVYHATKNEYVDNKPVCIGDEKIDCKDEPYYTDDNSNYPRRCVIHMLPKDRNILEQPCVGCKHVFYLNDQKLCNSCNGNYKDDKYIKHKELKIKALLESLGICFIHDKMIFESCFKDRPDFVIDCGTHIIIIEVDENQHSNRDPECEHIRMFNIFNDFEGRKVIFIRYNPDNYRNQYGMFTKDKQGRESRLVKFIRASQLHPPEHYLSAVYMYYDGDNGKNIIVPFDHKIQEFVF